MNLDKLVKRGAAPWEPSANVSALDDWHRYDVPLVGTFRVEGETVLFVCLGDASEPISIWAYCILRRDEAKQAAKESFSDADHIQDRVEQLFKGKEAVFALARDLEIKRWTRVHVDNGLLTGATEFVQYVMALLEEEGKQGLDRVRIAQIHAATDELALI